MRGLPDILKGCKVFPCSPGTKDPATLHGWKDASDDPAQIAEWQRINPDFNWAVACGPSGLFVFDIDPAGLDWWYKLLERDAVIKAAVDRAFRSARPRAACTSISEARDRAPLRGSLKESTRAAA
jgi:hypothetical protein